MTTFFSSGSFLGLFSVHLLTSFILHPEMHTKHVLSLNSSKHPFSMVALAFLMHDPLMNWYPALHKLQTGVEAISPSAQLASKSESPTHFFLSKLNAFPLTHYLQVVAEAITKQFVIRSSATLVQVPSALM